MLLGFIPFALVLGAQASHKGLSAYEVALMTGLNFGGGSEFAAIELWSSPPLVIVAMTLLVNSRHLLMGAALAPYLQHLPLKKALPSLFFMCDESWAMGLADAKRREEESGIPGFSLIYFLGVSLCLWLLIAVIAPKFASGNPADLIALALTLFAATRLPILPVVLIAVLATGTLRFLLSV